MKEQRWNLGDDCFIADTQSRRMRVMPAMVVRVWQNGSALGIAINPGPLGPISRTGPALSTERAARTHARVELTSKTSWLAARLTRIPLEGYRPKFKIPTNLPEVGQTVYVLDKESAEVLEVVVAVCGLYPESWQAGYDSSPGNPEANLVRIRRWYPNKEEALAAARKRYGKEFAFVTQDELAKRVDAQIKKLWDDASVRLRDTA